MRIYRRQNIGARPLARQPGHAVAGLQPRHRASAPRWASSATPPPRNGSPSSCRCWRPRSATTPGCRSGMNLTSPGLRDVVLLDLLNAPDRENPANLVICGSPGRGKSHIAKLLIRSWLALGAGVHVFDPERTARAPARTRRRRRHRRHRPRRSGHQHRPAAHLRPPTQAAEHTVDHLLPLLGYSATQPAGGPAAHATWPPNRAPPTESAACNAPDRVPARPARRDGIAPTTTCWSGWRGCAPNAHLRALFDESLPVARPRLARRGGVEHRRTRTAHGG